ncbi:uncharacterized protein M6B38_334995 [Iris pallida]|uniref:Hyccin n=1 Tax=Iris pallida TaxID=29817 RepID=A0AAX6H189_IRIPA|nr:uncharacterized protein M6B38_334995 [Iris pallida]
MTITATTTTTSSPSSSSSASTTPNSNPNPNSTSTWWESLSRARSRVLSLSPLLPSLPHQTLTLIADSDRPAHSLLSLLPHLSHHLSDDPHSGSGDDPLCNWLYDTYLLPDPPELRLLVLSLLPLLSHLYLSRVVSRPDLSLAGFEAVLLAVYTAEAKIRGGKPVLVSVPDLSSPSLYHSPRVQLQTHHRRASADPHPGTPLTGVLSPPLEPQLAVKSTKRACIVGVALDSFFKKISLVPPRAKSDFCAFVVSWAGQECRCRYEFDDGLDVEVETNCEYVEGNRIPLPWELLQPVLRIIGHCLLAPGNDQEVRDAASAAARAVYARAMHEIIPQAILAARSLIRLDVSARKKEREAAAAMLAVSPGGAASNPATPSKPKRQDVLLFSK